MAGNQGWTPGVGGQERDDKQSIQEEEGRATKRGERGEKTEHKQCLSGHEVRLTVSPLTQSFIDENKQILSGFAWCPDLSPIGHGGSFYFQFW